MHLKLKSRITLKNMETRQPKGILAHLNIEDTKIQEAKERLNQSR
jgi:hypothetical protein